MSLLRFKLISQSKDDAGSTIAALAYSWDALVLINSMPGRRCTLTWAGKVVWNNDVAKDGWWTSNHGWMHSAHILITERITDINRKAYEKGRQPGDYDRMIAAMDLRHEIEKENCAAAGSVRS
jgi:hypothetical protein